MRRMPRTVRAVRSSRRERRRMLACPTHGRLVWEHHVRCAACERVYTTDETAPTYAPELCVCGARLHPDDDPAVEFSARPVCPRCYAERLRAARGAA